MTLTTPDVSREFFLKLIESEIASGLMFVAVAESAYRAAKFSNGSFALSKAEAIHLQAANLAQKLTADEYRAVAGKLIELRVAIDWMMRPDVG